MKRKLSLLLAIVMILSLVPMSAFAAPNRFASTVDVDKTTVVADNTAVAKFTVYLFNDDNTPAVGQAVYVASKRGTTDTLTNNSGATLPVDSADTYYAIADGEGKATIKVKSNVAGTAKLAFATVQGQDLVAFLNGANITENAVGLIGTKEVTFTAASLDGITVSSVVDKDSNAATATELANGLEYYKITFRVATAGGAPVAGQEVTVSANKSGVTFDKTTGTTNAAGLVSFKAYSTKPGDFIIEGKADSKTATQTVTFLAGDAFNIERISSDNAVIAKGSPKTFKFKITDVSGNMIKVNAGNTAAINAAVDAEVIDEPDSSAITLTETYYPDGHFKITTSNLNEEGAYKVRLSLTNGKYAELNFTVKKQGDITKLTLSYDETVLPLDKTSATPTVSRFDAANVKKDVTLPDGVEIISGDTNIITVNADGSLKSTDDKDYAGKEVVITAIDKTNKLTATYTIKVGGAVVGFNASAPATVTNVDGAATVGLEFVDNKGNVVALGDGSAIDFQEAIVVSKPSGAIVTVEKENSDFQDDLKATGKANLEVSSNKAGDVVLQIIMVDGVTKYTKNVTVKFGVPAPVVPVKGAKSLVLNIASTVAVADGTVKTMDVAPFIKDGRTFVPVRFIAEQLGAEVSFTQNAAGLTETVTLTRDDLVVTMTMGSKDIKVVKAGVTTTVAADVAAYVEAGRTVLPFRALAEAMGAEVAYGMTADNSAVAWVSFNQK